MADDVTVPHPTHPDATVDDARPDAAAPVVAAVDGSPVDLPVTEWAADEAVRTGRGLRIVHVVEPGYQLTPYEAVLGELPSLSEELRVAGQAIVSEAEARVSARHPGLDIETVVEWGPPAAVLVDLSADSAWIVLGSPPRRRLERVLLGSVALATVAHAHGPVAVVPREHEVAPPLHVVVGVDGSTGSARAVRLALATAAAAGGSVTCVVGWSVEVSDGVVVTEPGSEHWIEVEERYSRLVHETVDPLAAEHPEVSVDVVVRVGGASQAVVEEAEDRGADLVVVGSRGHGGFAGLLLGSVSRRIVERAGTVVAVAH